MSRLNLLDNGIDSLKKGTEYLIKYYREADEERKMIFLKDSIIFLHHGTEIIIKYILFTNNEYLIFSQIDSNVIKAYKQMRQNKKNSVFETSLVDKLHTVTFEVACERVTELLGYEMSTILKGKLESLNKLRNRIIHSEVSINQMEIIALFTNFLDELNDYFYKILKNKYTEAIGYTQLKEEFASIKSYLIDNEKEYLINVYDIIIKNFEKHDKFIKIGDTKVITDIDFASDILKALVNNNIKLGADFYNNHSSGEIIGFDRISKENLRLYSADNELYYNFKFKKMFLHLPPIEYSQGIIIYLESDNDTPKSLEIIHEVMIKNKKIEYSEDVYDDGIEEYRFYSKGIFAFINIQPLEGNYLKPIQLLNMGIDDLYIEFMSYNNF
jgi:hypothetical protein